MKTRLLSLLVSSVCAMVALPAQAAPGFCSNDAATPNISVDDVKYEGDNANDCYGFVEGNLAPGDLEDFVNAPPLSTEWGPGWTSVLKDEAVGADSGSFMGLDFTLEAGDMTTNSGTWTLTATDTNGTDPLNLPAFLDFIVTLKASNGFALWFFNDKQVNMSNDGTWQVQFDANTQGIYPDLSHMDILMREGIPPAGLPEPASLALLGLALMGLAASRRHRG